MARKSKQTAAPAGRGHVAGEVKFLVCVGHDPHSRVAVHFACLRAKNSGGRVALVHVLPPPEFQHWIAVGEIMREETREDGLSAPWGRVIEGLATALLNGGLL